VYDITIDSSGEGSVTTPGEDIRTCDCLEMVDLVVEVNDCYEFIEWTGDTAHIND